jgi:DNA-binding transcriptional MerR regulator
MEMILRGKKLGFTLTEINDLIGGKGANETPDLEEQLQPQQIVNLILERDTRRQIWTPCRAALVKNPCTSPNCPLLS